MNQVILRDGTARKIYIDRGYSMEPMKVSDWSNKDQQGE